MKIENIERLFKLVGKPLVQGLLALAVGFTLCYGFLVGRVTLEVFALAIGAVFGYFLKDKAP